MSSSSPTNASPEKLGQGSRKSSLNAFTAAGGDRESDDSGYVTAEDEEESGQATTARDGKDLPGSASRGDEDSTMTSTPPEPAPMENASSASGGMRGLMGRMRL
jgi:hypothetical protein